MTISISRNFVAPAQIDLYTQFLAVRVETIMRALIDGIAATGGATVSPITGLPEPVTFGYVVAYGEPSLVLESLTGPDARRRLRGFITYALCLVELENLMADIGGWCDPATGLFHFDVTEHFTDLEEALEAGRDRGQIAIFDNLSGADILVGGL